VLDDASHEYDPTKWPTRELNQLLQEQVLTGSEFQAAKKKSA